MTLKETYQTNNAGLMMTLNIYTCDGCSTDIHESDPHYKKSYEHYCFDCAFIRSYIDEKVYLSTCGVYLTNTHAAVIDGEVVLWVGKKAPWERKDKDERQSPRYSKWRTGIFERDEYTCQHCNVLGGELNAHHIKSFAKYKKLRYELNNGLTLCVECHRDVHRKGRFKNEKRSVSNK